MKNIDDILLNYVGTELMESSLYNKMILGKSGVKKTLYFTLCLVGVFVVTLVLAMACVGFEKNLDVFDFFYYTDAFIVTPMIGLSRLDKLIYYTDCNGTRFNMYELFKWYGVSEKQMNKIRLKLLKWYTLIDLSIILTMITAFMIVSMSAGFIFVYIGVIIFSLITYYISKKYIVSGGKGLDKALNSIDKLSRLN